MATFASDILKKKVQGDGGVTKLGDTNYTNKVQPYTTGMQMTGTGGFTKINTNTNKNTGGGGSAAVVAGPNMTPIGGSRTPSDSVTNLFNRLNNQPANFAYGKQADLDAMYDKVMNRPDFKFDLAGDTLYRQYADQYANMGRQASLDAMGQAAALTGGYGNSYGASAGNQAYQQYLGQLNNAVMDVYDRQHQHYEDELQNDMNRYSLGLQDRGAEYDMYANDYSNWLNENQTALQYAQVAQGYVSNLLANGQMPSADMLAMAGLTYDDAAAMISNPAAVVSGGGGGKQVSIGNDKVINSIGAGAYNAAIQNLLNSYAAAGYDNSVKTYDTSKGTTGIGSGLVDDEKKNKKK